MEGFFTFVFVFILIIWLAGKILPLLFAWWIKRKIMKMQGSQRDYRHNSGAKERDVHVQSSESAKKVVYKEVGEYIDFEETN